jgi:hypothetical protein
MPASPTFMKRQKELARIERQKEKAARKQQRKSEKGDRPGGDDGEDPDLAGIVPGPQPQLED